MPAAFATVPVRFTLAVATTSLKAFVIVTEASSMNVANVEALAFLQTPVIVPETFSMNVANVEALAFLQTPVIVPETFLTNVANVAVVASLKVLATAPETNSTLAAFAVVTELHVLDWELPSPLAATLRADRQHGLTYSLQ